MALQGKKIQWISLRELWVGYRHILALVLLPISGFWFFLLESLNTQPAYIMYSPLDDLIPFVRQMVIPYYGWYLFIAVTLVFMLLRAPRDFVSLCIYMYGMQMIICIVYAIFPNGQDLRPALNGLEGTDIFTKTIAALYQVDTPTNSMPSIHVTHTIACCTAWWRYTQLGRLRLPVLVFNSLFGLSIIMSTVMIKQHSIIDVVAGITLSFACYPLVYVLRPNPVETERVRLPLPVRLVSKTT